MSREEDPDVNATWHEYLAAITVALAVSVPINWVLLRIRFGTWRFWR